MVSLSLLLVHVQRYGQDACFADQLAQLMMISAWCQSLTCCHHPSSQPYQKEVHQNEASFWVQDLAVPACLHD